MTTGQNGRILQINVDEEEANIIALFRQERSRLVALPDGWVFTVDANPDRLVSTFQQKDVCKVKRGQAQLAQPPRVMSG
jgi:hypothetical protein